MKEEPVMTTRGRRRAVTPSEWSVVLPTGENKPFSGSRHRDKHRFG